MKKLKYITVIAILTLFGTNEIKAQQDPLFSQYFWNKLIVNPAYAGSNNVMSATLIAREQWVGLDGRPRTQSFAFETPLARKAVSLGLDVTHDKLGPSESTAVNGNFVYRMKLTRKTKIAFGVKAGVDFWKADLAGIGESLDPTFMNNLSATPLPNFGAGLWWNGEQHFVGISAPRLLEQKLTDNPELASNGSIRRHYYLMGGYVFKINPILKFKPSALFRIEERGVASFDISGNVLLLDKFWGGLAYRSNESMGLNISYEVKDFFRVGYAYDFQTGRLSGYNSGSHELMLGYDFKFKKENLLSPRYF